MIRGFSSPMANSSVRCPKCGKIVPQGYAVQYGRGEKTVSYQCDSCRHAWQTIENAKPKPEPSISGP